MEQQTLLPLVYLLLSNISKEGEGQKNQNQKSASVSTTKRQKMQFKFFYICNYGKKAHVGQTEGG